MISILISAAAGGTKRWLRTGMGMLI